MKRHHCPHCQKVTIELTAEEYAELKQQQTRIVEKTRQVIVERVRLKSSRLTKRARLFLKRGCDVPPEMERDWETLKKSGMSSAEAAASLRLVFFMPNDRSE